MENIIRTAAGALLQTSQLLGLPYIIQPYSSLNEKLNVNKDEVMNTGEKPTLKYLAIGNGGHKADVGADGFAKIIGVQHTPKHTALYNQLPFVLRKVSDETVEERSKYRMRKLVTYNNTQYAAYYLKELDFTSTALKLELRSVADSEVTILNFTPAISDMSPVQPTLFPGYVLRSSGDYIAATAKVVFNMTVEDMENFTEVCSIIYGDDNFATISEIALCSGIARDIGGFGEAVCVQIVNFINSFYPINTITSELNLVIDLGTVEPLLVASEEVLTT